MWHMIKAAITTEVRLDMRLEIVEDKAAVAKALLQRTALLVK